MKRAPLRSAFVVALALWLAFAVFVAVITDRWVLLVAIPAAFVMFAAARPERLSQSAQLVWPILLLPGATFAFIGLLQAMGYGWVEGEPTGRILYARHAFFGGGLALHFVAFVLLATESRASDHPGGEIANHLP